MLILKCVSCMFDYESDMLLRCVTDIRVRQDVGWTILESRACEVVNLDT